MRYISNDGKVFDTEQECCEHEQKIEKQKAEEKLQRDRIESERKKMMDEICQKRKELRKLTENYQNKFGVLLGEYLPFGEFLKILYEC